MGSTQAANAVLAKMRAKYGKRLSAKDYENLVSCNSVSEVVTYLKNNTYYDTVLRTVNEREVHRGRLELILKEKLFDDFYSLCRYVKGTGEYFADYIIRRDEIEQIMHFLILLKSNSPEDYIFKMPQYFAEHTNIDLNALARARDYDSFFAVLTGTPYEKKVAPFRPKNGEDAKLAEIENALYHYCYDELYKDIEKHTSGTQRKELMSMFDSIMDIINFVRVLRLKKYYKESPEITRRFLFPYGTFSPAVIEKLTTAQSSAQVFDAVKGTKLGRAIDKMEYVYAGQIKEIGIYNVTKRNIHFSTNPIVGMLSYVFVMEQEYSNIVSIIEAVRYGVESDKIKTLVVL
ncbi:MAG: V-type ATPase subunit [Clostridia bacterium]|nr:V-type ATPase subunit [Clostridia bacterium]